MKPITRHRTIHSCATCRRRKIKCDKIQPICGNCQKYGQTCGYDAVSRATNEQSALRGLLGQGNSGGTSKRRRVAVDATEYENGTAVAVQKIPTEIESRLDRLTAIVEELSRKSSSSESMAESPPLASARSPPALRDPSPKESMLGIPRSEMSLAATSEFRGPALPPAEREVVKEGTLGFLMSEEGGRSRYIGNTHWAFIGDQLSELKSLLKDNYWYETSRSEPLSPSDGHGHSPDIQTSLSSYVDEALRISTKRTMSLSHFAKLSESLLDGLPSKSQCELLYRSYVTSCNFIYAIVQMTWLRQYWTEFWIWRELNSGDPFRYPTFLPLLFAILYGGARGTPVKTIETNFEESRLSLCSRMNDKVVQCLSAMSFLRRPHLPGLVAYIIIETMAAKEEEITVTQLSLSLILQLAQSLGLHREPSKMGIHPQEAEVRRRVWWHVIFLDTLCFTANGLPPTVNIEYSDVWPIAELKDTLVGSVKGTAYLQDVEKGICEVDSCDDPIIGGTESHVSPVLVMNRGKHEMAIATREISKIVLGTGAIGLEEFKKCFAIYKQLEKDMAKRVSRIPNTMAENGELLPGTSHYTYFEEIIRWQGVVGEEDLDEETCRILRRSWLAFHDFAKRWLKMLVEKTYCFIHVCFLRNPSSTIWNRVRQEVLPCCYSYLEGYIDIATNQNFISFHWWNGGHQPLHAMMVLLVDLYTRPTSDTATRSRVLIDRAFELTALDGGITTEEDGVPVTRQLLQGGQAAWSTLRILREKAWRKAGLDPEIVWSTGTAQHRQADETTTTSSTSPSNGFTPDALEGQDFSSPTALANPLDDPMEDFDWNTWDQTFGGFVQYVPNDPTELDSL